MSYQLYLLVDGQGYQLLGNKVDYKIRSSLKNIFPTSFSGSNPIHIQLENDASVPFRFVEVTFAKQVSKCQNVKMSIKIAK